MKQLIFDMLEDSIAVKNRFIRNHADQILRGVDMLAECIASGHKIMLFGNGGSAADAQHIAAEFVNRFIIERPPLAAIALSTDTSIITAVGNDYSFEDIFVKQIAALGKKDDIAVGISTSGNSANVIKAIDEAKRIGMATIGLSGPNGKLKACVDLSFAVESNITPRIQEAHITLGHMLCDLVDRVLFPEAFSTKPATM